MVSRGRQVYGGVLYVSWVIALAVLFVVAHHSEYRWHRYIAEFSLLCLGGLLVPLPLVWISWRQRREAARLDLPRPE